MFSDNQKVFIAGATGLAGSNIIQFILSNNPSIKIKGTYHQTLPFILDSRIEYVQADLTKREDCRMAVKGCDYAILAAAGTGGFHASSKMPYKQVTDNIVMDSLLLEAIYFAGVKRIIYFSSATVYQEFDGHIKEDDLDWNKDPHSSYIGVGWAKRSVEKLCQFWHKKYGLEIIIVRASNIFGPFAKFNPAASNFIPAIIKKAVDKMDPFVLWGKPDVTRDVIYSEDFARAIVMLLENEEVIFDTFNVGSGERTTVDDIVSWTLKFVGHTPKKVYYKGNGSPAISFRALDCSKIDQMISWKSRVSIKEGIKKTIEWWIENRNWWNK